MPRGGLRFVWIGIAMANVGQPVAVRQALEQVERAEALARGHRIRQFFVEDRDMHGSPFPGESILLAFS